MPASGVSPSDNARLLDDAAEVRDSLEQFLPRQEHDAVVVDVRSLRRFMSELPALERLFAEPVCSKTELIVRSEMRRTVLSLAVALEEIARLETCRTRAETLFAASRLANELGSAAPRKKRADRAH